MTQRKSSTKKPPLTDAERHQRFKDMALEVGADEDPASFDRAVAAIDLKHKSED